MTWLSSNLLFAIPSLNWWINGFRLLVHAGVCRALIFIKWIASRLLLLNRCCRDRKTARRLTPTVTLIHHLELAWCALILCLLRRGCSCVGHLQFVLFHGRMQVLRVTVDVRHPAWRQPVRDQTGFFDDSCCEIVLILREAKHFHGCGALCS